jgi:antirestriction protein ArdC
MAKSIEKFNGLNGTVATREELQEISILAKKEEQTHIFKKLNDVLENNQDAKFDIELIESEIEIIPASMLNGLHFEENNQDTDGLNKAVSSADIYQMITDKMLQMIKEASGNGYVKKWEAKTYGKGYTIPFNFVSKKRYRGVNVFLLAGFEPLENPFFLTFKQIEANKGTLKKGSVGYPVIYFTKLFKITNKEKEIDFGTYDFKKAQTFAANNGFEENDIKYLPILKYYNIFNGKDVENIDFDLDNFKIGYIENELPITEKLPIADAIINNYPTPGPKLKFGGNKASFTTMLDVVKMPQVADFDTLQDYYRTLFHEFSHSTGVPKRLNRNLSGKFGSKEYAFEELIAEWGATFLSAEAGIIWHTNKNHAEYIKNWNNALVHLKEDNKFIMRACTEAQKLTDFILQFDENGNPKYLKDIEDKTAKIEIKKPVAKDPVKIKVKDVLKDKEAIYPFTTQDIPYQTAYNAYAGISFSPEKRAVSEQESYFNYMKEVFEKYKTIAEKENKIELFNENFEQFKKGYLTRSLNLLGSKSRIFSTMIVGPAKFPVQQMKKRNIAANNKLDQLLDYSGKAEKIILKGIVEKEVSVIKTGSATALDQLKAKLLKEEKNHSLSLAANKVIKKLRKENTTSASDFKNALIKVGFSEEIATSEANYLAKNSYGLFFTTNSNARIKRIKSQIATEEKLKEKANTLTPKEITFNGGKIVDDYSDNRIKILFDGKPDVEIRNFIKKSGQAFKWSPKNTAWQRQLNTYYKLNRQDLYDFLGVNKNPDPKETVEKPVASKKVEPPKSVSKTNVFSLKINDITIDKARFQNRNKLNESVLKNIVDNYSETVLDPLIVWKNNSKTYLLAGHHRLEASKIVGKKTVPVKYFTGTEKEAIHFARVESNSNRSLETPVERAKIYREMRLAGDSKNTIEAEAKKNENKNASFILGLSYLNPKGITLETLERFENTDKQNYSLAEKTAEWIGDVMKSYIEKLNYSHEKEMFDFLNSDDSKRINTKSEFKQKISSIVNEMFFDASKPLNLKKFKYKTEGESVYDTEFNEIKNKINSLIEKKENLKERFSNPKNKDFVNPKSKDYEVVLNEVEKVSSKYNLEIAALQKKLIELSQNKGNYTNAGANQIGLFKPVATHSKIKSINATGAEKSNFFTVKGEVGKFLQAVERKPFESVVITLDGMQGAGKTTALYKFIDAFASAGNRSLFISGEEHPESSLAIEKRDLYLSNEAKSNTSIVGEVESLEQLYEFIAPFDIIFIDSWQKLQRMVGAIRLDEDLRKKFNGKVFIVIFQQTTTGRTKGGAEVVFDGDIIIKMVKEKSFADNYAYFDKNRYTKIAIEKIRYNIASGTTYDPTGETEPVATEEKTEVYEPIELSFELN